MQSVSVGVPTHPTHPNFGPDNLFGPRRRVPERLPPPAFVYTLPKLDLPSSCATLLCFPSGKLRTARDPGGVPNAIVESTDIELPTTALLGNIRGSVVPESPRPRLPPVLGTLALAVDGDLKTISDKALEAVTDD